MSEINSICTLCDAPHPVDTGERHVDSGTEYTLWRCDACGAKFWTPFRNPGAEWYERDPRYSDANSNPPLDPTPHHRDTISYLKKHANAGFVLDVGCGTGNFLNHARKNGWACYGFDFDSNAVQAAHSAFGLTNIELSNFEKYIADHPELLNSCDLVSFFDVFEHIDDHRDFVGRVSSLLRDGGHLALTVPFGDSLKFLQPNDLPPRHLTRWTVPALSAFFERHGYDVVVANAIPAELDYILMKLRFKYGKAFSFGAVRKAQAVVAGSAAASVEGKAKAAASPMVRAVRIAAKIKDSILFGVPAVVVWGALHFSKRRYNGIHVIARKRATNHVGEN